MTFVKYIFIQLLAYAIDLGGYLICIKLTAGPLVSNLLSKLAAGTFAFNAHRHFTFAHQSQPSFKLKQAMHYFSLLALNIPFSCVLLALVLHGLNHVVIAKIMVDVFCVGVTYWLSKKFIFLNTHERAVSSPAQ